MKLLIFGASGSGTTTLGKAIAKELNGTHLDADDYYWKKTVPPFQEKIPLKERHTQLKNDFQKDIRVVISGSLVSWSTYWTTAFDLAIFLHIPSETRMERLRLREVERYGELLKTDTKTIADSRAFLDWAKQYDDPNFEGRGITQHTDYMERLSCHTLKINSTGSVREHLALVKAAMH